MVKEYPIILYCFQYIVILNCGNYAKFSHTKPLNILDGKILRKLYCQNSDFLEKS